MDVVIKINNIGRVLKPHAVNLRYLNNIMTDLPSLVLDKYLFSIVSEYINPIDFISISCCSTELQKNFSIARLMVTSVNKNIIRLVASKFQQQSLEISALFCKLAIVLGYSFSGSIVLQAILGEKWDSYDIDLYRPIPLYEIGRSIRTKGCILKAGESEILNRDRDAMVGLMKDSKIREGHIDQYHENVHVNGASYHNAYVSKITSRAYGVFCGADDMVRFANACHDDQTGVLSKMDATVIVELIGLPGATNVYSEVVKRYDLDFCKNVFDGKRLQIHSIESLLTKSCCSPWPTFVKISAKGTLGFPQIWMCGNFYSHLEAKYNNRIKKYSARGFQICYDEVKKRAIGAEERPKYPEDALTVEMNLYHRIHNGPSNRVNQPENKCYHTV